MLLLALATALMTVLTVVNVVGFIFRPGLVPLSAAIVGAAGAALAASALQRAWHERG